jgi:hypothetical protein
MLKFKKIRVVGWLVINCIIGWSLGLRKMDTPRGGGTCFEWAYMTLLAD